MPGESALTLAIETSNPTCASGRFGVCLVRGEGPDRWECLGEEALAPRSRHDDALMPAIDALCSRVGVGREGISRVAVSTGPGGYTSLRIAVTTAKMLCYALGAACIGVGTDRALRLEHDDECAGDGMTVCLAWKREDVWRAVFSTGDPLEPASVSGLTTIASLAADARGLVLAEDALAEKLVARGVSPGRIRSPRFMALAVARMSFVVDAVDPVDLVPAYPREPEAVTNWRRLHAL